MRAPLIITGVIALLALAFILMSHNPTTPVQKITRVTIGAAVINVEVADTAAAREQGLSGRAGLAQDSGMLFIFDAPGNWGFWMKDMNFGLDIIFADAGGNIVTIEQNLSPQSYNSADPQFSKVFYPAHPALYVLEVPAGFAAAHNISVGERFVLQ